MKIDAPRAYTLTWKGGNLTTFVQPEGGNSRVAVRIVRESDWRKIMAVVKAADADWSAPHTSTTLAENSYKAWAALRKHLEKRK